MTLVVDKQTNQAVLAYTRYLVWKQDGDSWCLYWVTETFVHYSANVCGTGKSVLISKKIQETAVKAVFPGEDGATTTICDDDQEVVMNPDGTYSWKYNGANNFPLVPVPPEPGGAGPVFEPFPFSPESGYNCHGDSFGAGPGGPLEPPTLPVGPDLNPSYGNGGGWIGDPSPLLEPGGPFEECRGATPPDCPEGSILVLEDEMGRPIHSAKKQGGGYDTKPGKGPKQTGASADDVVAPYIQGLAWNADAHRWDDGAVPPGKSVTPRCYCEKTN